MLSCYSILHQHLFFKIIERIIPLHITFRRFNSHQPPMYISYLVSSNLADQPLLL